MKKLISLLSIGVLALLLASCAKESTAGQADAIKAPNIENEGEAEGDAEGETEREISPDELSEAIKKAIQGTYPGAEVQEADEVTREDGSIYFEVEMKYQEKVMELMYDEKGTFLGIEEEDDEDEGEDDDGEEENEREINPDELSDAIKAAIQEGYPGAELLEADEVTREDGSIFFDVEMKHEGKVIELMYEEDGTFLGVEEEDGDDDDDGEDDD